MPQLDHYNFTFSYFCFTVFFILTIILIATVYLPMIHRHQKVRKFALKEFLARNIILDIEARRTLELSDAVKMNIITNKRKPSEKPKDKEQTSHKKN